MSNKDEIIVIKGDEEENKKHRRLIAILIAILLSIALITYSGVNLIYRPSKITVGVVEPPLYWEKGGQYDEAASLGYVEGWELSTKKTHFNITVRGSPELTVIIDDIFRVYNTTTCSFRVGIVDDLSGDLKDKIQTLRLIFYNASKSPSQGKELDLKATQGKTDVLKIDKTDRYLKVQIEIILASNALTTEYATVTIRFTDITPP
jgi:flagellar basal body-associated protein FliL